MEKSATLNLWINPTLKSEAETEHRNMISWKQIKSNRTKYPIQNCI